MPTANGVAKFLDPKFSRYAKEETTQLAWRFIATKRCKDFPLGCKTHHKPYFSDTVYEILPDLTGQSYCGYKVAKVTSKWMPQISDHNPTGGMYILQRLPNHVHASRSKEQLYYFLMLYITSNFMRAISFCHVAKFHFGCTTNLEIFLF